MKNVINKHYAKLRSTILRKKKSVVKKKNWEEAILYRDFERALKKEKALFDEKFKAHTKRKKA